MRSLSLARRWRSRLGPAAFLSHCENDALRHRVKSSGIRFTDLKKQHPNPLDLQTTLAALREIHTLGPEIEVPWLVIDGYHFDSDYQQAIRSAGYRLMVLDDTAHLDAYHADVLLNQNITAEDLTYNCDPDTLMLLGTRYVLLAPEFLELRERQRQTPNVARKILVTLGGSDPDNITALIVEGLNGLAIPQMEARIVVGPANSSYEKLRRTVESSGHNFQLIHATDEMPQLMAWADIAVSGAGSTCWELAFMGVPSVLIVLANNQRKIAMKMSEIGAAMTLGVGEIVSAGIAALVKELSADPQRRAALSNRGAELVDGSGSERVISSIEELTTRSRRNTDGESQLRIRAAKTEDAHLLWKWADDPSVRANSINQEPIPWESHVSWYESRLATLDTRLWILEEAGVPLGQIRYDRDASGGSAEISFSVANEHRGRGYGIELIKRTLELACIALNVRQITAITFVENSASYRAFLRSGFRTAGIRIVNGRRCYALSWHAESNKEG